MEPQAQWQRTRPPRRRPIGAPLPPFGMPRTRIGSCRILGVSPRGVQILLDHPREAATLVDLGDLEATLLWKPSWGLRILVALAEHIKELKVGVSQWEKCNKRPLQRVDGGGP